MVLARKYLIASLVGIALGILNAKFLFVNSALALIPWTIAGLTVGYFTDNKKQALGIGGVYGFLLGFTFMTAGYDGSDPIIGKLLPFIVLGLFSAACGLVLGIVGHFISRKFR